MHAKKIRVFAGEVHYQCQLIEVANKSIDHVLTKPTSMDSQNWTFYHVQMLLSAVAAISKVLWAFNDRDPARVERQPLRDLFGVGDTSPFGPKGNIGRSMRNNFEHFDARLDTWWNEGVPILLERCFLGPFSVGFSNVTSMERGIMRGFDPSTKTILFMGESLKINDVLQESRRLASVQIPQ